MTSHKFGLVGIGSNVEVGKDGPRVKDSSGAIELRNNADDAYVVVRGDHPVDDNDLVTKRYLETFAKVIVTGQINGGAPPAAGTPGRIFVCTTAGGTYQLNYLYRDTGAAWEELPLVAGLTISITEDLTGGTIEFVGDSRYLWDEEGDVWVNIGPAPAEAATVKNARILIDHTDTGVNLIKQIPANAFVTKVLVGVTQVFNGTSPSLIVGDTGDTDRLMADNENKLNRVGVYEATNLHLYASATNVNATLTIGGTPTTGSAWVYVEYAIA